MDSEFIKLELFPKLKLDNDKINDSIDYNIDDTVPKIPDSFFEESILDNDLTRKLKNIVDNWNWRVEFFLKWGIVRMFYNSWNITNF